MTSTMKVNKDHPAFASDGGRPLPGAVIRDLRDRFPEAQPIGDDEVAIPCHRVVRKNGALSGYRWGFKRKRALLAREAAS